jgi:hypothetical protein
MPRIKRQQKTSAGVIEDTERANKIMSLRRAGATYKQIAAQVGGSEQNAHQMVTRILGTMRTELAETTDDVRALELERLDALLMGQWSQATAGHQGAVATVLRIMERRARILGIDAPAKVAPTTPDGERQYVGGLAYENIPALEKALAQYVKPDSDSTGD